MSEETNVKFTTTKKVKNPAKVESGKRLGAMSQKFKKDKAAAMQKEESANVEDNPPPTELKEIGLMVSVVGILVGVAGLYYRFGPKKDESPNKSDCPNESTHEDASKGGEQTHRSDETQKQKTKLDTLD